MSNKIYFISILFTFFLYAPIKPLHQDNSDNIVPIDSDSESLVIINNKKMSETDIKTWLKKLEPKLLRYKDCKNYELKQTRNSFFLLLGRACIGGVIRSAVQNQEPINLVIIVGTTISCIPDLYNLAKAAYTTLYCERKATKIENKIALAKKVLKNFNKLSTSE